MSSCRQLAERYASETGNPIPASDANTEVKQNWLLTSNWGCIPPGQTEVLPSVRCFTENDKDDNKTNVAVRPPVLNYLQETGFLHWVNQRGLQCINRMVGTFYGLNTATGLANRPGPSISPPDVQCWGACFQATTASDMCFECVKETLLANPTICPQLDMTNPANENMVRDSIACHECIALQSSFIPLQNAPAATPDQEAMTNNVWRCITGTVPKRLSTQDIIIIVVVSVFIVTIALTLGIYYGYFHPKILKRETRRIQLESKGLNPDDY